MRLANSLDSLDCVTNSIQQARANSWARARAGDMQGADQCYGSPQLLRINRSNSMRSVHVTFSNRLFIISDKVCGKMIDCEVVIMLLQHPHGRSADRLPENFSN